MGKEWPEHVAHRYGMKGVSLKFVHAHSQRHARSSVFWVNLFTTPSPRVVGPVAVTKPLLTRCSIWFLVGRWMPQGQKSQIYKPLNKAMESSLAPTALLPGKLSLQSGGLTFIFLFLL